jgi:hypothetical protein
MANENSLSGAEHVVWQRNSFERERVTGRPDARLSISVQE